MNREQTRAGQQSDERFISVLEELTRVEETFAVQKVHIYRRNAKRVKLYFRVSGTLIIGLSACLPFLATLKGTWISIVLPIVALTIAGLTGLNSFFRWESNWKGFSQTGFALEYMLKKWELKIIEAKYETDAQKAIEIATQATRQLLDDMETSTSSEAEEYFKRVQVPKMQAFP